MSELNSYNDYGPITWYKRWPIYLATILTALYVLGMFATAFLVTARVDAGLFAFSPYGFWRDLRLWQIVTYPLLSEPSFFFFFSIYIIYRFGVDVERYLGRSRYTVLLVLLILTPPLVNSALWIVGRDYDAPNGILNLCMGFFIAFATLYPNLEYWAMIPMKWLAFACIVLSLMFSMMHRDIADALTVLAVCGVAFGYVRFLQMGAELPNIPALFARIFRRKPKFKVVRSAPTVQESIDPLLDKIAKTGLSSLTPREKARLQRASESLKKPQ